MNFFRPLEISFEKIHTEFTRLKKRPAPKALKGVAGVDISVTSPNRIAYFYFDLLTIFVSFVHRILSDEAFDTPMMVSKISV